MLTCPSSDVPNLFNYDLLPQVRLLFLHWSNYAGVSEPDFMSYPLMLWIP